MNDFFSVNSIDILGPAFIAGLLVLLSHVPLGRQVLRRGIIFIDLAVAQAAATGALLATFIIDTAHNDGAHAVSIAAFFTQGFIIQACAAIASLLMVTSLHQLERRWPHIQEALIGGSFVLLASIAILISAKDPHGNEHMLDLMAGQILWTNPEQLIWLTAATIASLACMRIFSSPLLRFYIPFAIAITAAVQIVGVYLVFACLIFPALSYRTLSGYRAIGLATLTGAAGFLLGLSASLIFDLPSGPAIVVALALSCLCGSTASNLITKQHQPN
jgi:zinc/manganese transport system permease protein